MRLTGSIGPEQYPNNCETSHPVEPIVRCLSWPMLLAPSASSLFKWRQFEPEVILLAVGWYLRFSLSYRDVEELLAERGLLVDPSPSGGGFNAPELNRRVRKRQSRKTVALGRIEVAFYAMTQKIYTYCDEPATTVGYDYRAGAQQSQVKPPKLQQIPRSRRFAVCRRTHPGTVSDRGQGGSQTILIRPADCIARCKLDGFWPDHRASALPRSFHRLGCRSRSIISWPSLR
jgi:hypothetical protein